MYNEEKAFRELKKIYEEGVNSKKNKQLKLNKIQRWRTCQKKNW